eukprot:COSAG05_NODE_1315_length_5211_cov_2.184077_4_plen_157_part_00
MLYSNAPAHHHAKTSSGSGRHSSPKSTRGSASQTIKVERHATVASGDEAVARSSPAAKSSKSSKRRKDKKQTQQQKESQKQQVILRRTSPLTDRGSHELRRTILTVFAAAAAAAAAAEERCGDSSVSTAGVSGRFDYSDESRWTATRSRFQAYCEF